MKISQEDVILIKIFYLSKWYDARRVMSELPNTSWKLVSIDSAEVNAQDGYNCTASRQR